MNNDNLGIDTNTFLPPLETDEFVLRAEDKSNNKLLLFDPNNTMNDFFLKNDTEEKIIEGEETYIMDGKKIPTVESSSNITNKILLTNEKIIQNSNYLNGKAVEEILISNEEVIKNDNENILLGKKHKKLNEEENNNKYKNCGRKKKDSTEKGIHTKNKEDNMIIKIKIFIFNSVLYLLNNSYIYTVSKFTITRKNILDNKFLKIDHEITHSIKRKDNLSLLDMKLKCILSNKISSKFSNIDENHNKFLIENIYKEKKEIYIMNILELTFRELLNIFRGTISVELQKKINEINHMMEKFSNMETFLEKIKLQEIDKKESKESIYNYMNALKQLCMNFEKWFKDKLGRKRNEK